MPDSNKTKVVVNAEVSVVEKLDKVQHTNKLTQILDMMPTLNIKLNQHQKNVVASNHNLLCLGRSGTGKTTTSVLRLFAQEILYAILKKHQEQKRKAQVLEEAKKLNQIQQEAPEEEKKEQQKDKVNLQAEDIEKDTGVKMVFITASPVLTTEVKRFYAGIKQKLILHLRKKKDISEQEASEIVEKVAQEEQPIEDHEMKELLEFIRKEEQDIVEDLQIETQLNIPNSFDELQPSHFPLFITVKRLIYMMDACLNYSFFSRDHNNNIIGLDSNLGWHNESKGVMMINHYYKENIDYDAQIARFGKELLEMDKEAEIDTEAVDEGAQDLQNFLMVQEEAKTTGATHRFTG